MVGPDMVVLGFIAAVFATFILVVGAVTWWTEQGPGPARPQTRRRLASTPDPATTVAEL